MAGDTHFDDDETFTLKSKSGKNFFWVALHEFGHSLGLEHGNTKGTVMYPWYEGYNGVEADLSLDDKQGLQQLYGEYGIMGKSLNIKNIRKLSITCSFFFFERFTFFDQGGLIKAY